MPLHKLVWQLVNLLVGGHVCRLTLNHRHPYYPNPSKARTNFISCKLIDNKDIQTNRHRKR